MEGVAEGSEVLDTGADVDVAVHAWQMKVVHPRKPHTDVYLGAGEATSSPDYATQIHGLWVGPFAFPAMEANGRDRERERIGNGVALVGMGVMRHFSLAFDARHRLVWASPADSYMLLTRAGVEMDDRGEGPTVTRVVPGSSGARARSREMDRVRTAGGRLVRTAADARRRIARADGQVWMEVERSERTRRVQLWLEPVDDGVP